MADNGKSKPDPDYRKPALTKYGRFSELTSSGSGFMVENFMRMGMMRRP